MLSHVSLGVKDIAATAQFYDAVLGALGYVRLWTGAAGLGYGPAGGGEKLNLFAMKEVTGPGAGFHLAFEAPSPEAVERFHRQALSHGGADAGAPGRRPHYGAQYFAAFVVDPDGHKLEAVHQ